MLRRLARERREYLYHRAVEEKRRALEDKKEQVKRCIQNNMPIPTHLRQDALQLQDKGDWDDEGAEGVANPEDDEYKWAGVEDPKIVITTAHDPTMKGKQFAKEMRLIFPNAQRMNRGSHSVPELVEACRSNNVTDLIILHETRGRPDGITISHLPFGPTAYFTIYNTVMRHDVPDIGKMSEAYPHLIFHRFTSRLGKRTMNILKYLFPVPKPDSKRVITFANQEDFISFRHHVYTYENGKPIMKEVGPRFELKLFKINLGTLDEVRSADTEWVLRPYLSNAKKRFFLTNPEDDEEQ